MDNEILLVTGIVLAVLAIPAMVSAWSDGRSPRIPAIMVFISGTIVLLAAYRWPGGLGAGDVPQAFINVVGLFFR